MAPCPESTPYSRVDFEETDSRQKLQIRLSFLPVIGVVCPCLASSSQPFYLLVLKKSLPLYPFPTSSMLWKTSQKKKKRNSSRGLAKLEPVYTSFLLRGQTQRQSSRWQSTLVSHSGLSPSSESLSLTNSNSFSPPPHFFFPYQFKGEQWIPQAHKNVTRCQKRQPGRWCMAQAAPINHFPARATKKSQSPIGQSLRPSQPTLFQLQCPWRGSPVPPTSAHPSHPSHPCCSRVKTGSFPD